MRVWAHLAAVVLACQLGACGSSSAPPAGGTGGPVAPLPLVQPGQLVWDGAFRVPQGNIGSSSFGYSAAGPWRYDARPRGLYMVGHDYQQQVAEISIPRLSASTSADRRTAHRRPSSRPSRTPPKAACRSSGAIRARSWAACSSTGDGSSRPATATSTRTTTRPARTSRTALLPPPTGTATGPHSSRADAQGSGFVAGWMAVVPSAWQALARGYRAHRAVLHVLSSAAPARDPTRTPSIPRRASDGAGTARDCSRS